MHFSLLSTKRYCQISLYSTLRISYSLEVYEGIQLYGGTSLLKQLSKVLLCTTNKSSILMECHVLLVYCEINEGMYHLSAPFRPHVLPILVHAQQVSCV